MKLVYVAGPYRSLLNPLGVERNILDAKEAACAVLNHGKRLGEDWFPVTPHLPTGGIANACTLPDEFWLAATMEVLRRCDAVAVFGEWHTSEGTKAELKEAVRLGMPIYISACGALHETISTTQFTEE